MDTIIIPILWKLRHEMVKGLPKSHCASEFQSQDLHVA